MSKRRSASFSLLTASLLPFSRPRKEKSLGLLCENFLRFYGGGEEDLISLDEAATRLLVERRRIYDVVRGPEKLLHRRYAGQSIILIRRSSAAINR